MTTETETDTRQRNNELLPLVMSGDAAAREEMILLNMPLATFKVDAYLSCFPHLEYLREDLISEGYVALVDAVNRAVNGGVRNPTGYLSVAIQKQIGQSIDAELFATSKHSARYWRGQGDEPVPLQKVPNSDYVLAELEYDTRKKDDLKELIVGCCESDEECAIVDLRMKGYKDDEIARQLDIPKTTVFMLRRELHERCLATGEIVSDS